MFRKNTASQFLCFQGIDASTGAIKTGVTWTVRRCIDGTFAAAGGTVTEDGTTGWYKFAMTQADTNGNNISFNFTGSGAVPQTVNIVTTAADPTDAVRFGLTALPNAVAGANGGLPLGDASGRVDIGKALGSAVTLDANNVINVSTKYVGGTIQTAGDIPARLPAALGANGNMKADVRDLIGTAWLTPSVAGTPDVNAKQIGGTGQTGLDIAANYTAARAAKIDFLTGDIYGRLGAPAGASVSADVAATKADTAAIKLKTDNLPSDPADASDIAGAFGTVNTTLGVIASYVDTEVAAIKTSTDAIKTKTDQFVFTVANQVDSNALSGAGGLDAVGVRSALGLASANLDTQLDALPTNAELATALGTADDAVLAQVALVKAKTDLIPASPAAVGDIPTANENADALLDRDMSAGADTHTRSPRNALRILRNKMSTTTTPGSVEVFKEDDTTSAWTATLTTDPSADPITEVG